MDVYVARKRLSIKSWRRGTKELDLILGRFSDNNLLSLGRDQLDLYEQLLSNDDQVIYTWIFGKEEIPKNYYKLLKQLQKRMYL